MATALTASRIYVLDWAPGGNDPENYDLDGKTEGTNYVVFKFPERYQDNVDDKKMITPLPNVNAVILALGYYTDYYRANVEIAEGTQSANITQLKYIKDFHEAKKTTTALYLVVKFATDLYFPFVDNGTLREYSKGCFAPPGIGIGWNQADPLKFRGQFTWFQKF